MQYKASRFYDPYYTGGTLEGYSNYCEQLRKQPFSNRLKVGDFAIGANLIIIKCTDINKYRLESPNGFCSNSIHKAEATSLKEAKKIYLQMLENFNKCELECIGDSAERDRLIGSEDNIYKKYLLFAYSRILLNEDSVIYKHSKVERQKDIKLSRTWYYNPFYEFLPETNTEEVIQNNDNFINYWLYSNNTELDRNKLVDKYQYVI